MSSAVIFDEQRLRYETPLEGISLGRYIARRMHKMNLLKEEPGLLARDSAKALAPPV